LLNDQRFPKHIQHLRRLYPDPITGSPDWQLVRENGGIVGIRSQSAKLTFKKDGFAKVTRAETLVSQQVTAIPARPDVLGTFEHADPIRLQSFPTSPHPPF
jgi:hypothetical protein